MPALQLLKFKLYYLFGVEQFFRFDVSYYEKAFKITI